MAHTVVVSQHGTCRYGLIPKVKGGVGRSEINAGEVSPSPGGHGPPGWTEDRGAWEKRLECSAGPSPMGLGAGASFTSDHVAGEGRVEAETSQAVGGHLPSVRPAPPAPPPVPQLPAAFYPTPPLGEGPGLLPQPVQSPELLPPSGPIGGSS